MGTRSRSGVSRTLRETLVAELERRGLIRSERVRETMLAVPRELFVREFAAREGLEAVYRDDAILTKSTESGIPLSSSSQPAIMAQMLEQLELEDGMRVLEIGAGTGYNAALLSLLVGRRGRVVSVDVDAEVAARARRSLRDGGFRVRVARADGRDGYPATAPYDRIIVTASSDTVPLPWFTQLDDEGLLETPLRLHAGAQVIPVLRKTPRGFRSVRAVCGGFMPLRGPGEDGAVHARAEPSLVVTDQSRGGADWLLQLSGICLATLSQEAKRRLIATALGEPRRQRLGPGAGHAPLAVFLSLTLPRTRRVTGFPPFAIGAIGRDGRSLALFEVRPDRKGRGILTSYGTTDAEDRVVDLVRDWERCGCPTASDLTIAVRYDGDRPRLTVRWPTVS